MKKILFILLITPFIFFADKVYAYDLPAPMTYHSELDCGVGSGSCISTTVWPEKEAGLTNGFYYSQTINQSTSGFVSWNWGEANLCSGQNMIISGEIKAYNGSHLDNSGFITGVSAYMYDSLNPVKCSFANTSKTTANFTCSGKGGGIFRIVANYSGLLLNDFIGVSKIVNLTCEATTNDILNAQNQNTNTIINNQNQNTQNVINNQNANTNAIIGASGAHAQLQIDTANQNQAQTNQRLDELNDNITNDNIDSSSASGFFSDFEDNDYGLSSVITAPLRFIQNLTNNTCNPLSLNVPFVEKNFSIPCMNTIYQNHFGTLYTLYQTVTTGFIAYWVCVRVFALVKGFKDPENDKIEVMDL